MRFAYVSFLLRHSSLYSSPNIVQVIKARIVRCAGRVARTGGRERYIQGFGGETPKEIDHLEYPGVDGRIILR